jgi:hypothetical protein
MRVLLRLVDDEMDALDIPRRALSDHTLHNRPLLRCQTISASMGAESVG